MNEIKKRIYASLEEMRAETEAEIVALTDAVSLLEYCDLMRQDSGMEIWSAALQQALYEHEVILIPARKTLYYIDEPVVIPSNRHIEAEKGAVIRQTPNSDLIMFRNAKAKDGTHAPISNEDPDVNISIRGGRWEESHTGRAGYGKSNKYDKERSYYGVSTCMFFSNLKGLSLTDMEFWHTAGFSVQIGDVKNSIMVNIRFDECFADGLHINGNCENVIVRNITGWCGDDLVAFNMYDWLNSSVNFGPLKNVLCENVDMTETPYKTMRIQPGIYWYDDGSAVDCSITDAIIKKVKGVNTFKLYYQTPAYQVGELPERGAPGSADHLFFEDIEIDFQKPLDELSVYMESDPIRGTSAGFEMGSKIGRLYLENVRMTFDKEKWPMCFLACIGPKSASWKNERSVVEVFDPYVNSFVEYLELCDVTVNREKVTAPEKILKEVVFDDIHHDGRSSGQGEFKKIVIR